MVEVSEKRWYVVHTYSGHENKVKGNIERAVGQAGLVEQIDRVLIPTESVAEMKNGKKTVSSKKFFPSYVLVHMEMSQPIPEIPYRVGEHVRVVDGPFSEFTGVVDEINQERGKLKVMVSIFGRATPVELDFLQVQPV
jgi:transcriptional antiterminator NusG